MQRFALALSFTLTNLFTPYVNAKLLCSQIPIASQRADKVGDQSEKPSKWSYLNPVVAIRETLKNQDKFHYVFVRSPLEGLLTNAFGVTLAMYLGGASFTPMDFISNYKTTYLGYQITNILRNSINLNRNISDRFAVFLNWYYSTISYGLISAGPLFATADTKSKLIFATSTAVYAGIWPIISQTISRKLITPVLYEGFFKKSDVTRIKENKNSKKILGDFNEKLSELRAELESIDLDVAQKTENTKLQTEHLKMEIRYIEQSIRWTHFLYPNGKFSKGRFNQYTAAKLGATTLIASAMITMYFLLSWQLVGHGFENANGIIHQIVSYAYNTFQVADLGVTMDSFYAAVKELVEQ